MVDLKDGTRRITADEVVVRRHRAPQGQLDAIKPSVAPPKVTDEFNKDDPRYFKSRFISDSRMVLMEPEYSNHMAIHYWRIRRIQDRINELLSHTDELVGLIDEELNN